MGGGFNYPWSYNREGGDIGPNPYVNAKLWQSEQTLAQNGKLAAIPLPPLFDHLDRNLLNLKALGISVVRFFLLSNGFNYAGVGPNRRGRPSPNPLVPYYD